MWATSAIDHRVLLPVGNPKIAVHEDGEQVRVDVFGEPRYVFPRRDCAILPIANSTAEKLAEYLAHRVSAELANLGVKHLSHLELEIEESPGQTATYRMQGSGIRDQGSSSPDL